MSVEETSLVRTGKIALVTGALLFTALAIARSLLFPTPPPAKSIVFGCYTTTVGSPIRLEADGMDILQKNFPRIGFDLERHKTGIILAAQAPIVADPVNGRYVYRIARLGGGWFLDFFKTVNGHRRGVFDEHELSGFTMLASDGNYLPYEKAPIESCQDARS